MIVGNLYVGNLYVGNLYVGNLYVERLLVFVRPLEAQTPLLVDPNAELPLAVAMKVFASALLPLNSDNLKTLG